MHLTIYGRRGGLNGMPVAAAQIDPQDGEVARRFRWYLGGRKGRYVMACTPTGTVLLHRLLLDARPGQRVGHRNGDALDNRRANLLVLD
ncbi:hypothetical protein E7T06_08860 [Deinococcus sp. Arct2-2]|uniref:hypothetical protein n=1 Tax=Deinococcus sp. Arct2-2 TaxID=2568653 RepID=UPI0010A2DB55|nr:hypothetical protein [Deinococcus sp. Arct2-2]THF70150.1 hypothetical protein E7T06_08860 [Deinococcus sp. Arct2-2]